MKNEMKFLLAIFLLFPLSAFADCAIRGIAPDSPTLCGNAIQGGFVYGESDWSVNGMPPGPFVMGIPMDAPDKLTIRFCKNEKCESYDYKIRERKYREQKITVDDKFINYPPNIQKRIDSENERMFAGRAASDTGFIGFMDWRYPFDKKYRVSGVYGSRRVFNGEPKQPHKGLDIAAGAGTPIRSIGSGKVVLTMDGYLSGKTVLISHGFGIYSVYIHLNKIAARAGDVVNADSVIGTVGKTGRASGPHLHLGLYHNETPLDPELLFLAD